MVTRGIVFLKLIKRPEGVYPGITQPWYYGNTEALGTFDNLELYFILLKRNGLVQGYYPRPIKIIMTVHPDNLEA